MRQPVKSLQNRPRNVLVPKPKPEEKAIVAHLLTVHHLAEHGDFSLPRDDLNLLAHSPCAGGLDTNSMRADIVGKRSLTRFPVRESRRRETHFHHNGESSFFSAAEAAFRAHSACTLAQQLEI